MLTGMCYNLSLGWQKLHYHKHTTYFQYKVFFFFSLFLKMSLNSSNLCGRSFNFVSLYDFVKLSDVFSLTFWCVQLVKSVTLEGHTEAVCAVDAVYQSDEPDLDLLIASAASDSTVRIWSRHGSEGNLFLNAATTYWLNKNVIFNSVGLDFPQNIFSLFLVSGMLAELTSFFLTWVQNLVLWTTVCPCNWEETSSVSACMK